MASFSRFPGEGKRIRDQNDEECDARDDDSSTKADYIIINNNEKR
jgi:hypothetical protein